MTERHANPEDFDLYALSALDGEERRQFEAHLRVCSTCQRELNTARECVALLGLSGPELEPPPSVKAALMERARGESRPLKAAAAKGEVVRGRSLGLRFALVFAATTALLAIAAVWLWRTDQQQRQRLDAIHAELHSVQDQLSRDEAATHTMAEVFGAPDTVQVALLQQTGGPPGQAHVFYNSRLGVLVYSGEIAPAPADKTYQLWLVPASGAPLSAGLVSGVGQGSPTVVRLQEGLAAKAFAVTLEPRGGQPQPTGPKVLVGLVSS
jgi:anti-sigma-K factor RskA